MRQRFTQDQIEEFRSRLCAVAEDLFAEHGVEGVTMRQIAQHLGMSQTAAYRYFLDKQEILAAVRASAFRRYADRPDAARTGRGALDDAGQSVQLFLRFAADEPST
uniref:TetR/AcrR family transcriptional regulator n=1 Tax=Caballeronia sp. LjRoot34 TaxID=3342325 RepID=UPI003F5056EB